LQFGEKGIGILLVLLRLWYAMDRLRRLCFGGAKKRKAQFIGKVGNSASKTAPNTAIHHPKHFPKPFSHHIV
jgi:hypothetical protein